MKDIMAASCCCTLAVLTAAAIPRPEYPRPRFVRGEWCNLNGDAWTFTFDQERTGMKRKLYESKGSDRKIVVPVAPQSVLSGIGHTDVIKGMWYHRKIEISADWAGKSVLAERGKKAVFVNENPCDASGIMI